MRKPRAIPFAVALIGAAAFGISGTSLALSIKAFNEQHPRSIFYMQELNTPSFEYAGRPAELTWELDELGRGQVTLAYGDAAETFEVGVPTQLDLPGLSRFNNWLKILRFVEVEPGRSSGEVLAAMDSGELPDRLAIVTRTPRPEDRKALLGEFLEDKQGIDGALQVDEDAWGYGEVMRSHWLFGFYELRPEGGINAETLRFPSSKYMEDLVDGELRQGTWQYDAALRTMPKGSAPKQNFTEAALVEAGQRLGIAGVGIILFAGGLAFAFAPTREERAPGPPKAE